MPKDRKKPRKEDAPGLPDRRRYGNLSRLPVDKLIPFVVQLHEAHRAGPHHDLRFGPKSMFSWAVPGREGLPQPGQKRLAIRQPLHRGSYADFEGEIHYGYGAGRVTKKDQGRLLVTEVKPDKIKFVLGNRKFPETFVLIKPKKFGVRDWLLINTTPVDVADVLGKGVQKPDDGRRVEDYLGIDKIRYKSVDADDVDKLFDGDWMVSEKIDGAAAIYKLFGDKIEVLSYRTSKEDDRPILHTYRVGGHKGARIPDEIVGSVLRGEIYGVNKDTGKSIPSKDLGGILNATLENSLDKQKDSNVELRNALFRIYQLGKDQKIDQDEVPVPDQHDIIRDKILPHLPGPRFRLPRSVRTPEAGRRMWEEITSGRDPATQEGIVAFPMAGGRPVKVKPRDEWDVYIRSIFPGEGKYKGTHAGGFEYSFDPDSEIVGKVGTGLSDEVRKQMWENQGDFVGRVAKLLAQEQFPDSGALRAPVFHSLHEDKPSRFKEATVPICHADSRWGIVKSVYRRFKESSMPRPKQATAVKDLLFPPITTPHSEQIQKAVEEAKTQHESDVSRSELNRYLAGGAITGATLAAAAGLYKLLTRDRPKESPYKGYTPSMSVLNLPGGDKSASFNPWADKWWFIPAAGGGGLLSALIGLKAVRAMVDKRRGEQSKEDLDAAHREFEDVLASTASGRQSALPKVASLAKSLEEAADVYVRQSPATHTKYAEWPDWVPQWAKRTANTAIGGTLTIGGLVALASGFAAYQAMKARDPERKKIKELEEAHKIHRTMRLPRIYMDPGSAISKESAEKTAAGKPVVRKGKTIKPRLRPRPVIKSKLPRVPFGEGIRPKAKPTPAATSAEFNANWNKIQRGLEDPAKVVNPAPAAQSGAQAAKAPGSNKKLFIGAGLTGGAAAGGFAGKKIYDRVDSSLQGVDNMARAGQETLANVQTQAQQQLDRASDLIGDMEGLRDQYTVVDEQGNRSVDFMGFLKENKGVWPAFLIPIGLILLFLMSGR